MVEKKGWSWLGFLFAPHYYAGYGKLQKGIILAALSGALPLIGLGIAIYGGIKAKQELPIKEAIFNWGNVAITVIVLVVASIVSQALIVALKG